MTNWYRSTVWDEQTAEAFEARLARARAVNRPQYIRIQGVSLAGQPAPATRAAGRRLIQRVIDEYPDDLQAIWALSDLADTITRDGDLEDGIRAWRDVLAVKADPRRGRLVPDTDVELTLAELLLQRGDQVSLQEADDLLTRGEQSISEASLFRNLALRYLVVRARVAAALHDQHRAADYATQALVIAGETTPSIPNHPDLGRPDASPSLVAELIALQEGHRSTQRTHLRRWLPKRR